MELDIAGGNRPGFVQPPTRMRHPRFRLSSASLILDARYDMKSTNMLERLNKEIKRRTHVVRIFPNTQSCLQLIRALFVKTHENWLEALRKGA